MRWLYRVFILLFSLGIMVTPAASASGGQIYVPIVTKSTNNSPDVRTVNAPYFNVSDLSPKIPEMAIFWFGKVTTNDNYTDVRIGYNNSELFIRAQIFDRRLWYDPTPNATPFENWDAMAVTLDLDSYATSLSQRSYRFLGELYWWEGSTNFKKSYQGSSNGWIEKSLGFNEDTSWRGDSPNNNIDDRGWVITFRIPFNTLGLSGPPTAGTFVRLGFTLYDRDSNTSGPLPPKSWPENYDDLNPNTWGGLRFGLVGYTTPGVTNTHTTVIRQGLQGFTVPDEMVGGGTVCGDGLDFWTQWGNKNYQDYTYLNIQNQADVSDWPCFSKYYITFPITSIPSGKKIKAAQLTLYQFGNSDPSQAQPSFIQVLTINENWDKSTITWNNAPLSDENYGGIWVDPLPTYPGDAGVARTWDISNIVSDLYNQHKSIIPLVLYSSDTAYHSGKYFLTSSIGDWNINSRPSLTITWGD